MTERLKFSCLSIHFISAALAT